MTDAQERPATPGGAPPPLPPMPEPTRRSWPVRLWTAVVLTLLFAVGIWLGRLLTVADPAVAGAAPTPASTTTTTLAGRAPASCISALDRGDLAIHLLVKGIRDRRLSDQLKSYLKAANACRKEVPPG
jgi:hypothetical protein